jgi:hypothetical protein
MFGLCAWFITPRRAAAAAGYLSTSANDEYAFLTADALRIAELSPDRLSVTIVGDSSLREAISDPADLARQISSRVGQRVDVHLLTTGGLSLIEQVALTDCVRNHVRGAVILEVAPYNFSVSFPALEPWIFKRIGFQSKALRDEMRRSGHRPSIQFGNYFLDNVDFFAAHFVARCEQLKRLGATELQPTQHLFNGDSSWSDDDFDRNHSRVFGWTANYKAAKEADFAICGRMIERLQQPGTLKVGLLPNVQNPLTFNHATPHDRHKYNEHALDIAELAAERNVVLLDVNRAARLEPGDFLDYTHIGKPTARRRYTTALAEEAARLLELRPTTGRTAATRRRFSKKSQ